MSWLSHLSWVFVGPSVRPYKEDYNVSAMELLYGVLLSLPRELVDDTQLPSATFLEHLRQSTVSALPTKPILAYPALSTKPPASADLVFMRR